jgi:hypothetical protein
MMIWNKNNVALHVVLISDRNKTLDELSMEEGTILFVWDGQQVKAFDFLLSRDLSHQMYELMVVNF